jgi:hypothetical protein
MKTTKQAPQKESRLRQRQRKKSNARKCFKPLSRKTSNVNAVEKPNQQGTRRGHNGRSQKNAYQNPKLVIQSYILRLPCRLEKQSELEPGIANRVGKKKYACRTATILAFRSAEYA